MRQKSSMETFNSAIRIDSDKDTFHLPKFVQMHVRVARFFLDQKRGKYTK
jgi:hypothetical protein